MKRKHFCYILIAVAAVFCLSVAIGMKPQQVSVFYTVGAAEKPDLGSDATLAFEGDTIAISNQELTKLIDKKTIAGQDDPEENAVRFLLKREALYQLAVGAGCTVDDQAVKEHIRYMKDMFARDDIEGKDDIAAYIAGTGLSSDEYWDSQFTLYKKELSINAYLEAERKSFVAESQTTEPEQQWQDYVTALAERYIAEDNVRDLSK